MVNFVEMLGGVLVLRRIAAADVAALQAKSQLDPPVAHFHALRAIVSVGLGNFDGLEMTTWLRHVRLRVPAQPGPTCRASLQLHK